MSAPPSQRPGQHDRRRVTPDRLRQVLDIHAAKGIEGVMDEMH